MKKFLNSLANEYNEYYINKRKYVKLDKEFEDNSFFEKYVSTNFISYKLKHIPYIEYEVVPERAIKPAHAAEDCITKLLREVAVRADKANRAAMKRFLVDELNYYSVLSGFVKIIADEYNLTIKNSFVLVDGQSPFGENINDYNYNIFGAPLINAIPKRKSLDSLVLLELLTAKNVTTNRIKYFHYVSLLLHYLKKGASFILYSYIAPHDSISFNIALLFAHIFEKVEIKYPLNIISNNNKGYIIGINKINDIPVKQNDISHFVIKGDFKEERKSLIKFECRIFEHIKKIQDTIIYLLILKFVNPAKYVNIKSRIVAHQYEINNKILSIKYE